MKRVDDAYVSDAYHSLSIEAYRVSREPIERVRGNTWNPETNEQDRGQRNAMAARGHWRAYQAVQKSLPFYVDWYSQRGFKIVKLDLGADCLEGNGDLLWHPGWSRVYAGYGFRSTESGVEKFGKAISRLEIPVVPLHLVDPYCYHLDTCFCPLNPLNNEAVLIYPGAYTAESLAALRPLWKRVHELTADEAHKVMGNGIVANGRYFTSHITTHLESILCEEGLAPLIVESSEFEKSGGSLFCMKAFLP